MSGRPRLLNDKRAITPVLSNLLLTVVAVAAMAMATTATYVISGNLRETMGERVLIEDVWFDDLSNSIRVYLRNTGKVAVQINSVYVNHTSRSFSSSYELHLGEHGWLLISTSWAKGALYYVDIATARGTHVDGYYKAP